MKLSKFATDPKAERSGVWVDFATGLVVDSAYAHDAANTDTLFLNVCRWNKPAFQNAIIEMARRNRSQVEVEDIDVLTTTAKRLVARHLLNGWVNLTDDDDEPIPHSEKGAIEIFMDPRYSDFYEAVVGLTRQRELFVAQMEKADTGN